jgi:hypothetical protein
MDTNIDSITPPTFDGHRFLAASVRTADRPENRGSGSRLRRVVLRRFGGGGIKNFDEIH